MKKIILSLLLLSNFLSASYLYDKDYPLCIEDYYVKGGSVYYLRSSDNTWTSTTENNTVEFIYSGYFWDVDNKICKPEAWTTLGISITDWNFLNAFIGLLFGFFMLVVVSYLFMNVGGKK